MKGALGMECFSLKRLCAEGLWGGSFTGTLDDMLRNALDTGISLSIGAPLGNLEGILLLGLLREKEVYLGFFLGPRGY